MISAREKGFFQLLLTSQIVLMSLLFWGCFLALFAIGTELTFAFVQTYMKYWIVVVVAMTLEGLARPGAMRPTPGRMKRLASAVSRRQWVWILACLTGLLVFSRDLQISRTFLALFAGLSLVGLYVSNRFVIRGLASFCSKRFNRLRLRTMVLGPEHWCRSIIPEVKTINTMLNITRVETTDRLENVAKMDFTEMMSEEPIDLLIMPPRHLPDSTVIHLLRQGDRLGFRCWMPVELSRTYGRRFDLQKVGCLDVLSPPVEPLENTVNQIIKRTFDIAFSFMAILTLLGPLCILVWMIHRRYSPGPLFFRQSRVGKNGVPFQVFKFRTMHVDNPDEAKQASKGDVRIFRGGAFLRKSSIDEIPQFLNVLIGDMSVVGPRPHMEKHDTEFREIFERYGLRRYVKPGVTGLAQVKGFRGEINRPQDLRNRARLDNFYITHWDVSMDLGIVAMTGVSMLKPPKSAY